MNKLLTVLLTLSIAQASFAQTKVADTSAASNQSQPKAASKIEESCGCELPVPNMIAVVNNSKLTLADIETVDNNLPAQVAELQKLVVEARRRELDLQINSKLLEAEASSRKTTIIKLLETEVVAKIQPATDTQAKAFYEANKARIQGDFDSVKNEITAYIRVQQEGEEAGKFAARLRAAARVKIAAGNAAAPPATPADRQRVLAEVNDVKITSGDIEDSLAPLIYETQQRVHDLRNAALERRINDALLQSEADKRKLTAQALLEMEVTAKLPKVTEADALAFYNQNKNRINGEFAQIKEQIVSHLQTLEESKAMAAFADRLRRAAGVQTFLKPPSLPVYNISIENQPLKGNPAAKVTIVEFSDFQCPSCAQNHLVLKKLLSEHGDSVKLVVRNFPLSQHKQAFKAAEAAEAAREQGKYWEYAELLFQNQNALEVVNLKQYASQLKLDRAKFDAALDTDKFAEKIQQDLQDGRRLGINGTPTLFINGKRVEDRGYESLKAVLKQAVAEAATK